MTDYRPDPRILTLGGDFYDPVAAADFPSCTLRFANRRWAERVGLGEVDWAAHFCRFAPLPGNLEQPLALRYHGHQFRHYNPDIGDGRGFLFAQLRDDQGRLLDLGTKGSGQTPWSRTADGRLTLKGGVREVLATEMLEALGVNTSKSFALFETGEELERGDEPSPTRSAVLVRLSHGHIRIGTFERLATLGQTDNIARLTEYCLRYLFDAEPGEEPAAELLAHAVARTARLAASYIAAGFVHGVLNSDNINVTGESFDYGPWRWAPNWDKGFTAAYFDQFGLYAFARQPEAIHWNLVQLARALSAILPADRLTPILEAWPRLFQQRLCEAMLDRIGVEPKSETEDLALVAAMEKALSSLAIGIDRFFFDWRGGAPREAATLYDGAATLYDGEAFADFHREIGRYAPRAGATEHEYWSGAEPCRMLIDEVETIWADIAERDDWSTFAAKIAAVRRLGEASRLPALQNPLRGA